MADPRQPEPTTSRALWVTVVLSLAVHALLGLTLGYSVRRADAVAVVPPEPQRPRIDFELIDTPESAEVEESPDSSFLSNRNTRAQDLAEDAPPANRRPRISEDGEVHDLRAQATAPNPGVPQPGVALQSPPFPAQPPAPEAALPEPQAEEPVQETRERPRRDDAVTVAGAEEQVREEESERPAETSRERRPPSPPAPQAAGPEATALVPSPTPRQGKISYNQAERDMISKAVEQGEFSYEATQSLFADYFLAIKNEVETKWNLMLFGRYSNLDPSRTIVHVLILPDGTLGEMVVTEREGDELFPVVSSAAIRNSAPFGPIPYDPRMPTDARNLPLRIRFQFTYR